VRIVRETKAKKDRVLTQVDPISPLKPSRTEQSVSTLPLSSPRVPPLQSFSQQTGKKHSLPSINPSTLRGTREDGFFNNIVNDRDMLNRFKLSQLNNRQTESNKKKKKSNNLFVGKHHRSNNNLAEGTDEDRMISLASMRDTISQTNQRDLTVLDNKSIQLTQQLNAATDSVNRKFKVYTELLESKARLLSYSTGRDDNPDTNIQSILKNGIHSIQSELSRQKLSRQRMTRIIDICHANKSQNDDWLRSLTYYSTNLSKMIDMQKNKLKQMHRDGLLFDEEFKSMFQSAAESKQSRSEMVNSMNELNTQNSMIRNHLISTTALIEESHQRAQQHLHSITANQLDRLDENILDQQIAKKNQAIRSELKDTLILFNKYKDMFDPEEADSWEHKHKTKQMMEHLSKMKELEREVMQKDFDLAEAKRANQELEMKIDILKQTQELSKLPSGDSRSLNEQITRLTDQLAAFPPAPQPPPSTLQLNLCLLSIAQRLDVLTDDPPSDLLADNNAVDTVVLVLLVNAVIE